MTPAAARGNMSPVANITQRNPSTIPAVMPIYKRSNNDEYSRQHCADLSSHQSDPQGFQGQAQSQISDTPGFPVGRPGVCFFSGRIKVMMPSNHPLLQTGCGLLYIETGLQNWNLTVNFPYTDGWFLSTQPSVRVLCYPNCLY